MALAVGSRLAHHDVTALIGEGGMGEVYRARDTKLDRDVALKVLPQVVLAVTLAWSGAPVFAQASAPCRDVDLSGRVAAGELFEAELQGGLVFRLEPETHLQNPQGWTVKVLAGADRTSDYLMVATPPYRFSNPRYVDTGFGVSPEEALAWTPRSFAFVANEAAYAIAQEAVAIVLWPGNHAEAEVTQARSTLERLPTYAGTFWIEDGAPSPAGVGTPRIEWMKFRVSLCLPL